MQTLSISLVVLAILALSVISKLAVISPGELALKFQDNQLDFSLSNYGNIPFGAHLTGRLVLFQPLLGCSPPEEGLLKQQENPDTPIIAVIRRGECRVAVKIRNAQLAGARVAIIVNNKDEEIYENFGHEQGTDDLHIPALMIKKKDGDELISYLKTQKTLAQNGEASNDVLVSISFVSHEPKSNVVGLDFWYSSSDVYKSSYSFLNNFYHIWKSNKYSIVFRPHFVTWTCEDCRLSNFNTKDNPDCLSGGRYCAPDPDEEGPMTGADIIWEDLIQACILKTSNTLWWEYVNNYEKECVGTPDMKECGNLLLNTKATKDQRNLIDRCIKQSFELPPDEVGKREIDPTMDDNNILRAQKCLQLEYGVHQFPVLFINHKAYSGKLQQTNLVFEEICRSYKDLPEACRVVLSRTGETSYEISQNHTGKIIVLIVVMVICASLVLFYFKRVVRREHKDMSLEIGGLVNKYFALKDAEETLKEDETTRRSN